MSGRTGPRFATSHDNFGKRWQTNYATTTTYRNGDPIPQVTDQTDWVNLTIGAWCYYNNDSNYNSKYGKLYNWYAATDPRNIAPYGYKVPALSDFGSDPTYNAWYFLYENLAPPPPPYYQTTYSGFRGDYGFELLDITLFFIVSDVDVNGDPLFFAKDGDQTEIAGNTKYYGLTLWFVEE